jgi:hypothetical protein
MCTRRGEINTNNILFSPESYWKGVTTVYKEIINMIMIERILLPTHNTVVFLFLLNCLYLSRVYDRDPGAGGSDDPWEGLFN